MRKLAHGFGRVFGRSREKIFHRWVELRREWKIKNEFRRKLNKKLTDARLRAGHVKFFICMNTIIFYELLHVF